MSQQPPFLICVPIDHGEGLPGLAAREIEGLLDRLGNPAGEALRTALNASGVIHFLSLSVVWDENSKDPPVLVADIAGDGTPSSIITALVDHAWGQLLPVFQVAAGVDTKEALQDLLQRRWVKPVGASIPLWPHRVTGLAFQGTPSLTVARIKEDDGIVRKARSAILDHTPRGPSAAMSYLGAARQATSMAANPGGKPFNYSSAAPSLSRAGALTKAWTIFGLIVIDWSFLFIFVLLSVIINFINIIDPLENNAKGHDYVYLILICLAIGLSPVTHVALQIFRDLFARVFAKLSSRALILALLASCGVLVVVFILTNTDKVSEWFKDWPHHWPLALSLLGQWVFNWWMAFALSVGAAVLFLAVVAGILLWLLRRAEERDRPHDADPDARLLAEIIGREDRPPHKQNHLIAVSTISPGFFRRRVSLPAGLYAASLTVRSGMFRTGFLAGIGEIHFLQWACLPGTRKLVFTANYDGSFQSYLEDAISLLPGGATGIWSNTVGFPKTRFLFSDGAKDGDRFKRWVRRQMIPTRFWYSAYPHLTATDIRLNAAVRQGLEAKAITPSQAQAWLELFGSAPRPVSDIETDQIQGVALSGYRDLVESVVLPLSFPQDQGACRAWLAGVLTRLHFGDEAPGESAMAVALSARGMERLGLDGSHPLAARFSPAFAMGMANAARANILGDLDGNAPERWDWGGPQNPADAVLLIYAKDPATLQGRLAVETASCGLAQLGQLTEINLRRWPAARDRTTNRPPEPIREPFGFVDGISQPSIKGLRASSGALARDLLEPGEFILGYPDGRQTFPPTPQVLETHDPRDLLPDLPPDFPAPPHGQPVRDLGRNGSYLVIRQLKQDVAGFHDYAEAAATPGHPADWVKAKMVGRWPNGAPLILFPQAEPPSYDPLPKSEDFLFGRDDPQGLACPFGAHIRRANPRDQFDPDDKTQMSITNRHRIIRRGRSYVAGDGSEGLLFMCLNADIERQFEFLQQTWIGSTAFGQLRDEADPLTGLNRKDDGIYTIPALGGPKQLTGIPSFVSVIGGGYFFLPGRQALSFLSS